MIVSALALGTASAHALTIVPSYDTSITSRSNAAQIEAAFQAVVNQFDAAFASPVVLKIPVGWGEVDGQAIPSSEVSSTIAFLRSGFDYQDATSMLQSAAAANPGDQVLASVVANLPATDPTHLNNFEFTYGEAQALGILPASMALNSGFIGFSSTVVWNFGSGTIPAGQYSFQAMAAHELGEVMGRVSGLTSAKPTYGTLLDLMRYASPGVSSFSYSSPAYFSIDGGKTNRGAFNYSSSGDRGDWNALPGDAEDAYVSPGVTYSLSSNDWMELDALGWQGYAYAGSQGAGSPAGSSKTAGSVPEPAAWATALLGFGLAGALSRRQRTLARTAA